MALALQSFKRGLEWEHREVERDSDRLNELMPGTVEPTEEDAMGDIFLGDITMQAAPEGRAATKIPSAVKRMSNAAIIATALLGGGLGAVALDYLGSKSEPPAAEVPIDIDTVSTIELDR